jgi:sugar-specific transcriptional regulator TrmB
MYACHTPHMERTLTICLTQLGCGQKHIKFYLAVFELGTASLIEIAKKARLQRSTAYIIAAELIEMGLVGEDHKTHKKHFVATEPDLLLQKLEAKHRKIGRNTIALREALPELRAAHQSTLVRPRVRTFNGRAGLLPVWKDILSTNGEILLWTNQEVERQFFGQDMHDSFIKERVRKGIPARLLAVDSAKARKLQAEDSQNLRETRILPAGATFTSETYIYGNKVAVIDIGNDIFAVITESEQITASHKNIFELVWRETRAQKESNSK